MNDWKRVRFTPKAQSIMFAMMLLGFGISLINIQTIFGSILIFSTTGTILLFATAIIMKPIGWLGLSKDAVYDSNWRKRA